MVRSRTSTAPTRLRSQVARVATTRAMFMKYSSQLTRESIVSPCKPMRPVVPLALLANVPLPHQEQNRILGAVFAITVTLAHGLQRGLHVTACLLVELLPLVR